VTKHCDSLKEEGRLAAIINVAEFQSIMDDFHHLTGMVTAILEWMQRIDARKAWVSDAGGRGTG